MLDPVSFLLYLPDLAFSFVYRRPSTWAQWGLHVWLSGGGRSVQRRCNGRREDASREVEEAVQYWISRARRGGISGLLMEMS